jgi:hypothetical protein
MIPQKDSIMNTFPNEKETDMFGIMIEKWSFVIRADLLNKNELQKQSSSSNS